MIKSMLMGDAMLVIFLRTVLIYLILVISMRILGKRQLGQLEPPEVVVTLVVADLAVQPMTDPEQSLFRGLLPILSILGAEYLLSLLSMRSVKIRKLLCGKPVILIDNGKFILKNMRKTRITMDELISQLREKDVLDPSTVQYAILETEGNLSVFLYARHRPATAQEAGITANEELLPVTVITDGRILDDNLKKAGKDRKWLEKILDENKTTARQTLLLTVDSKNKVSLTPKET